MIAFVKLHSTWFVYVHRNHRPDAPLAKSHHCPTRQINRPVALTINMAWPIWRGLAAEGCSPVFDCAGIYQARHESHCCSWASVGSSAAGEHVLAEQKLLAVCRCHLDRSSSHVRDSVHSFEIRMPTSSPQSMTQSVFSGYAASTFVSILSGARSVMQQPNIYPKLCQESCSY